MKQRLFGVFVGGGAKRMGGEPKGLLRPPDGSASIVERTLRIINDASPGSPAVLVGDATAYRGLRIPSIDDQPAGIGPLGGLSALLAAADQQDFDQVVVIGCDMPHVSAALLARLLAEHPDALAVAPKAEGRWQPLFARYETAPALDAVRKAIRLGQRPLHRVIDSFGVEAAELLCDSGELAALRDWDRPEDITS